MGTYKGKSGNDIIIGSSRADFIFGYGGDDMIRAGGGDDQVYGGDGNDTIYGDGGNDTINGDAGNDHIYGGDGNDGMSGSDGDDTLEGGAGNDGLNGGAGNDILLGGDGNDFLGISTGNDSLSGNSGADLFRVANESDQGGNGMTVITDFLVGTDLLQGRSGWDANKNIAGEQRWEYVGSAAPTSSLPNGNGQATFSYENGATVLRLYNNDGDFNADLVLAFQGQYDPHDLNIMLLDSVTSQYTDSAIVFGWI